MILQVSYCIKCKNPLPVRQGFDDGDVGIHLATWQKAMAKYVNVSKTLTLKHYWGRVSSTFQ